MIKNNPFTSDTFTNIWYKHFVKKQTLFLFNFINNINFYKLSIFPIYINVGRNLTKGISYSLNAQSSLKDFKKKVCLLYDVPAFFNIKAGNTQKGLKSLKIKQYPGFLIDLEKHKNFNNYFSATFSKSSIQKFRRYKNRLEKCFNITHKMYIGNIDKQEYDSIFNSFKHLLTKRFDDKQITNNNLNPKEWNFYYDVVYPLILERKASLFVTYNDNTPIAIRLNYYSEDIIFDAITVFDIDYNKFHIGKISIIKILEWAFENNYKIFDFSKGYFDYKEKWSDLKYDFEYHLYYDAKSIKAIILANSLAWFFRAKQYLRDMEMNKKLHEFTYLIRKKETQNRIISEISESEIDIKDNMLIALNLNNDLSYLKKNIFDFLFITNEHLNNLKIYQVKHDHRKLILLKNKKKSQLLLVS
ncbi:GNAT family N-acetyltransferase [Flavivirga sp. 57AJ16]|uniref:GNAT family N-acetyltransferase n=1 Tax=Flavivirga sp. 57AJ16 TaxID=3025307 RepID=UPI0023665DFE|nr:GNAT family N-acetyltransferase [Flavivirga sp. 57AJ16]MDD7885840.1 GNAT family N-acetyltransferase [Flavivirga sp. 57AJ16]